jgi:hypothetical protein
VGRYIFFSFDETFKIVAMKKLVQLFILSVAFISKAFGQSPCDSLTTDAKYSAFTDTLVEINVINTGSSFFSYPGFILYNASMDTVAKETVNLFGIGPVSNHVLKVYPGMPLTNAFNSTLQLYTNMYSSLSCTWNKPVDLCPTACVNIFLRLENADSTIVTGTTNWSLMNGSSPVASGSFLLDNITQYDEDTICVMPGNYSLNVSPGNMTLGGQPFFSVLQNQFSNVPHPKAFYIHTNQQLPFILYQRCFINSVAEQARSSFGVNQDGSQVTVLNPKSLQGTISLYDINGRKINSWKLAGEKTIISLDDQPPGFYVVRVNSGSESISRKIILLD